MRSLHGDGVDGIHGDTAAKSADLTSAPSRRKKGKQRKVIGATSYLWHNCVRGALILMAPDLNKA
mgnify:CR=1 FL=1